MSDKNKNNIFYKPELDYEKSYETEGRINSSIIGENNQVSENIIDEFNNTINKINNILNLFPNDLKETASNPLKIIQVMHQNCGNKFDIDQIGILTGGCNPIPILDGIKAEDDEQIVIDGDALVPYESLFKEWKQ